MKVDLDQVECRSAFDLVHHGEKTLHDADTPAAIRLAELADVLYLPDVLDPGQSLCLSEGRTVPVESILDCWTVDFFHRMRRERSGYRHAYLDEFDVERVTARVAILGNVFSRNFGHWTEELLKVAALESAGEPCHYVIPNLPTFARESLRLLGIDDRRISIVHRPTVFTRAVFTTAVSHQNVSDYPAALSRLRDMVDARLGQRPSRFGRRLWLERGAQVRAGGVTLNRDEVARTLAPYGFDIVDMGMLEVADQFASVRHATMIAGPHGSQFVHAQFMPTKSAVIECFSPIHVNPSILQICRALRQDYRQIVSRSHVIDPYGRGRDILVDCEHLALVLDSLVS